MTTARPRTLQSAGTAMGAQGEEIAALGPWFHNLHLPDGTQTAADHPLGDYPRFKWQVLQSALPEDLHGVRALDIGCNAGFYSFALAARGAEVLAVDHDPHYLRQAEWAKRRMPGAERITFRQSTVYDLARLDESFDLVLFLGVFYHLRYPLLALDIVSERASDRLVFQSLSLPDDGRKALPRPVPFDELEVLNDPAWPRMAFVEDELAGDPTNWWIPNVAAIEAMLRTCGFAVTDWPGQGLFVCRRRDMSNDVRDAIHQELRAAIGTTPPSRTPRGTR